jgi:glycosyltransferase involved in cell wall biosynthesis
MPTISVVLPTYNRARVLNRAVDSVLAQDFTDFEVIVVDDGSKDETASLMQSYCDPRVIYIRQPGHRGGNACRNRGIMQAKSDLICFLDSDDAYLPYKLRFIADYFTRYPNIDVLIDSFKKLYPPDQGRPPRLRINPALDNSAAVESAVYRRQLYKATPSISARRQALLAIGLFDETLNRRQDMDLLLRLVRSCRCATTDRILWTKYWTADGITSRRDTYIDTCIEICRRHPDYLRHPDYRVGLARDLALHCLRLIGRGKWVMLGDDMRRFIAYRGWTATTGLALRGLLEICKRRVTTCQRRYHLRRQ